MTQILIVEDDPDIGTIIDEVLRHEGYGTVRAYSGSEALLVLKDPSSPHPDLIVLDLMLPGASGEEVLAAAQDIPVIVVSARSDTRDKVQLLRQGARDYMTKPFSLDELLARIEVQLRERSGTASVLRFGSIIYDVATRAASVNGLSVQLTPTESAILQMLLENPRQVLTKSGILDALSRVTPDCTEGSLKMHVSNLRRKLRQGDGNDWIEAVWGVGFRLRAHS